MTHSSSLRPRARLAVLVTTLLIVMLGATACETGQVPTSPATGREMNSDVARAHAQQLVLDTANAIGVGVPHVTSWPAADVSCGGDGFPHGPDVNIEESATIPLSADTSVASLAPYFEKALT